MSEIKNFVWTDSKVKEFLATFPLPPSADLSKFIDRNMEAFKSSHSTELPPSPIPSEDVNELSLEKYPIQLDCITFTDGDKIEYDYNEELRDAFKAGYTASKATVSGKDVGEKLFIKVGENLISEIDRNLLQEELFNVDFPRLRLQIHNDNGFFEVSNGVNGWDDNCFEDYQGMPVTFLTTMPTLSPSQKGRGEEKDRLLSESNSIIRSFNSVIERKGVDTNWNALGKQVSRILKEQRDAGVKFPSEETPSSIQEGEERMFTLKEALHIAKDFWDSGIERFCFDNGSEFVEGIPPTKKELIKRIFEK